MHETIAHATKRTTTARRERENYFAEPNPTKRGFAGPTQSNEIGQSRRRDRQKMSPSGASDNQVWSPRPVLREKT